MRDNCEWYSWDVVYSDFKNQRSRGLAKSVTGNSPPRRRTRCAYADSGDLRERAKTIMYM